MVALVCTAPVLMGLAWGNLQSVTTLGVGLYWYGRRRRSDTLMGVGIAIAAVKVIPAIPLVVFALLRDRRLRPCVIGGLLVAAWTLPIMLASGQLLVTLDFLRVAVNMEAVRWVKNLSPALWAPGGIWAVRLVASLAGAIVLARVRDDAAAFTLLLLLACAFVQNLYGDWFLMPIVGLLAMLSARGEQTCWAAGSTQESQPGEVALSR